MRTHLALACLALCAPLVAAPAAGAADDEGLVVRELRTVYVCDSEVGGGDTEVFVRTLLPRTVGKGAKLSGAVFDFTIVVPEELTRTLRDFGVEEVSGRSDDATYRIGPQTRKIRELVLPPTEVPDEGLLILEGQGTAQSARLRKVGTYAVKLPKAFTADVTAQASFTVTEELTCELADGARSKIAKVRVE